jgi:DNA polymerase III subunit epsilon
VIIRDTTFTAIDFESAGDAPGLTDAPVQTGMASMLGTELRTETFFRSYIQPQRPVTWAARRVHGITTEQLSGAPAMAALWPEFRTRLSGRVVVAHSAGTEKRFLRAFPLHGFGPWVDTLTLARRAWPGMPEYSLEALAGALGFRSELDALCPGLAFHDALYDAVAALLVLRAFVITAGMQESMTGALPGWSAR